MTQNVDIVVSAKDKASGPIKDVNEALGGLDNASKRAQPSLSALSVALGSFAGNMITRGVDAITGMGQSVVQTGIQFDDMKQQATLAFTTMLGDAGKANAYIKQLVDFAAKTPFEFGGLLKSTQGLLAMGFAADEVLPDLTKIGDAVAGLGMGTEGVNRVTLALGQMKAKGKVSGEEMMQLTEAGIPAWQFLADKIGKSVPDAMDIVSGKSKKTAEDSKGALITMADGSVQFVKGLKEVGDSMGKSAKGNALDVNDAIQAILDGMESKFGGLMESQSHTWSGLASTIGDTWKQIAGSVMEPTFKILLGYMQNFTDFLSSPLLTDWAAKFGEVLGNAVSFVATGLESVGKFFTSLMGTIGEMTGPYGEFVSTSQSFYDLTTVIGKPLANFILLLGQIFSAIGNGTSVIDTIQKAIYDTFGPTAGEIFGTFATIVSTIIDLVTQIGSIIISAIPTFVSWSDAIKALAIMFGPDMLWGALTAITATLAPFVSGLIAFLAPIAAVTAAIATLRIAWEKDWGGIRTTIEEAWATISPIFQEWMDNIEGVYNAFRYYWALADTENATLSDRLIIIWNGIKTLFTDAWTYIGQIVQAGIAAFKVAWDGLVNYVKQQLPGWMETLKDWGAAAWQWIVDTAPIVMKVLGEWVSGIIGWIGDRLPDWIAAFLDWEAALFGWIADTLPKAIDALAGFIRGLRSEGEGNGTSQFTTMAGGWAERLWKWITEQLIPSVGPAFGRFIDTMARLGQNLLMSLVGLAVELGKTLWQWIVDITPKALSVLADWGGTLWGWIKEKLPVWMDYLAEWAGAAWTWIRDIAIPFALKTLGEWGTNLWDWLKDNLPKWVEQLGEWAGAAWVWIRDVALPNAITALGNWLKGMKDWLETNWPTWRDKVIQSGADFIEWLKQGIVDGVAKLEWWLFSEGGALGGFLLDIMHFLGISGKGYEVMHKGGENIVLGITDGIESRKQDLEKQGYSMGESVDSALRRQMIIKSPSQLMFQRGQSIGQGMIDGVASFASQFAEAGSAIGTGIANGLKSSISIIQEQLAAAMKESNDTLQAQIAIISRNAVAAYKQQYLDAVKKEEADAIGNLGTILANAPKIGSGSLPNSSPLMTVGGTNFNQTIALMDAINSWKNTTLSSGDEMNDYLADIKKLMPKTTDEVRDYLQQWLDTWQKENDPLNDYLANAQFALKKLYNVFAGAQGSPLKDLGPQGSTVETATPDQIIKTLGDALGLNDVNSQITQSTTSLLGGINLTTVDIKQAQAAMQQAQLPANTLALIDAMNNWRKFFLSSGDPLNDFLADIKKLAPTLDKGTQDAITKWLAVWKQTTDPLNDYFQDALNKIQGSDAGGGLSVIKNFIAGMQDFISSTLKGSGVAFDKLSADSIAAYNKGTTAWQKWLNSDEGGFRTAINSLFYSIRDELTTLLGHTTDAMAVASPDNAASVDLFLGAAKDAIANINSNTDMAVVQKLLQNLVDYRSLTNDIAGKTVFESVLPTDARLTGTTNAVQNQYNITLQGSQNANTDVLSLVQLLNSLQTGAVSP